MEVVFVAKNQADYAAAATRLLQAGYMPYLKQQPRPWNPEYRLLCIDSSMQRFWTEKYLPNGFTPDKMFYSLAKFEVPPIPRQLAPIAYPNRYLVALQTGGLMEDPGICYSGFEVISAANAEMAVNVYNAKHRCTYFYGTCLAEQVGGVITPLNNCVTIAQLLRLAVTNNPDISFTYQSNANISRGQ